MKVRWFALATAAFALIAWLARRPTAPPRMVEITNAPGQQSMPALSPDGEHIAYAWNGADAENDDVYVQATAGSAPVRLTNHPAPDLLPSWSPDGTQIAFVRQGVKTGIYVVSAQGGEERELMEFDGDDTRPPGPETRIFSNRLNPIASRPSWTPDGRFLAVTRFSDASQPDDGTIFLLPVDGGSPKPFLPRLADWHYRHPVFSPDGRRLAVSVCGHLTSCEIQVMDITADLRPQGPSKKLKSYRGEVRGMTWSVDGKSLIVAGFEPSDFYSIRIDVEEPWKQEKLASPGAIWPSVSARGGRIAFSRSSPHADLWKFEPGGTPSIFLPSIEAETHPRISPTGDRVAFFSTHEGAFDLWTVRPDGSERLRVAPNVGRGSGSPAWSPDGQTLAFDATEERAGYGIWTVQASGGRPRRIPHARFNHLTPAWSPDGNWIYFDAVSGHSGWLARMRASGGESETVLKESGSHPAFSADGQYIYFLEHRHGIWSAPAGGGEPQRIVPDPIIHHNFQVTKEGIYYMTAIDAESCEIRFFDFATKQSRTIAKVAQPVGPGLAVTPGGRSFVWSRSALHSNIVMLEKSR